jgi:phosphodiesterase/alkaline phosphatase D-like protein
MNKNVIIGILVVLVILGGGYALLNNKPANVATYTPTTDNTANTTPTPNPQPTPVVPPKPDAPVVETGIDPSVSSSTALFTGTVKPNGAFTTYWFEYGETTALGNRSISQQIGSGFSTLSTPAYITGLKANTAYYFRLSAKNRFATVNGSTYSFQTNNTPPVPGRAPTTRTNSASDITRTTATVHGSVNPNGSDASYWFEYGTDTNLGNVTSFQGTNNGNSSMSVSASLSGLNPLMKYYFRLNAQNQYGTVNGSILSFTTSGPAAPTSPSVNTTSPSSITNSGATVNGRINPNGADTNYWFEYSTDSLLGSLIGSGTSIQTIPAGNSNVNVNASLINLSNNTKYYYRLVGRNAYGTVNGSIMSFKTKN